MADLLQAAERNSRLPWEGQRKQKCVADELHGLEAALDAVHVGNPAIEHSIPFATSLHSLAQHAICKTRKSLVVTGGST